MCSWNAGSRWPKHPHNKKLCAHGLNFNSHTDSGKLNLMDIRCSLVTSLGLVTLSWEPLYKAKHSFSTGLMRLLRFGGKIPDLRHLTMVSGRGDVVLVVISAYKLTSVSKVMTSIFYLQFYQNMVNSPWKHFNIHFMMFLWSIRSKTGCDIFLLRPVWHCEKSLASFFSIHSCHICLDCVNNLLGQRVTACQQVAQKQCLH